MAIGGPLHLLWVHQRLQPLYVVRVQPRLSFLNLFIVYIHRKEAKITISKCRIDALYNACVRDFENCYSCGLNRKTGKFATIKRKFRLGRTEKEANKTGNCLGFSNKLFVSKSLFRNFSGIGCKKLDFVLVGSRSVFIFVDHSVGQSEVFISEF